MDLSSYFIANSYSAISPILNTASAVCTVNGEVTDCGILGGIFGIFGGLVFVLGLVVTALLIVSMWKVFVKAGKPGWACLIPIYNVIVLLQIVKKPLWWIILFFIPLVGIIVNIIVTHNLSKAFGKDIGFTIGLLILPFVFYPILAFGDATYIEPADPVSTSGTI